MQSFFAAPSRRRIFAVVLAVFAAATGVAILTTSDTGKSAIEKAIVSGPTGTAIVTAPVGAVDAVEKTEVGDHDGLADPTPTGVTGAELKAGQDQAKDRAKRDDLPDLAPDAAPTTAGCLSRFLRVNYRPARANKPLIGVAHITVSPDSGRSGVNAITVYFGRPAVKASSNYVVSGRGHCNYIVRESDVAYTQAGFNWAALSVEVTGTPTQGYYLKAGGVRKVASLFAGWHRRWGIPFRIGKVRGCTVTRSGFVDHHTLGPCGGNHSDIQPYTRKMLPLLIRRAKAIDRTYRVRQRRCRELTRIRQDIRRHRSTGAQRDRARALKKAIGPRAATCR